MGTLRAALCVGLVASCGGSSPETTDAAVVDGNPGIDGCPALEICNGQDDDCDGQIDEDDVCPPMTPTCVGPPSGAAPTFAWDYLVGALGGVDVAIAASGAVLVVGQFNEPVDLGGGIRTPVGDADSFVLQLDSQGLYLWDHTFGTAALDIVSDVAVDAQGNVYVGGLIGGEHDFGGGLRPVVGNADAFVVSYDASGGYRWDVDISGSAMGIGDMASALAIGSDGSLVVAGRFGGDIDVGLGPDPNPIPGTFRISTFVVELDRATGAPMWDAYLRASLGVEPHAVALDPAGEPTVVGELIGDIDFGGGIRTSNGSDDGFALHLGPAGAYAWDVTFGDTGLDDAFAVASLATGVAVAGRFNGTIVLGGTPRTSAGTGDGLVFGTSATGGVTWAGQWAGGGGDSISAIASSSLGLVVTGTAGQGTVNLGGADRTIAVGSVGCPVVGYQAAGGYQWETVFGGASAGDSCVGLGVATGPGNVIALTGQFQGEIDFGGGARTATGAADAFVVALCP